MSSGERPIGAANGNQPNTEALCQAPPSPPLHRRVAELFNVRKTSVHETTLGTAPPRDGYHLVTQSPLGPMLRFPSSVSESSPPQFWKTGTSDTRAQDVSGTS